MHQLESGLCKFKNTEWTEANMSSYQFIASNQPLPEVENPHVHLYSLNEAVAHGITLDNDLLEMEIDPDEPEVIMWYESEELLGEITIRKEEDTDFSEPFTQLPFTYTLEWGGYTEKRAEQLMAYIKENMTSGSTVELWDTWINEVEEPTVQTIPLTELSPLTILETIGKDGYEKPTVLIVEKK